MNAKKLDDLMELAGADVNDSDARWRLETALKATTSDYDPETVHRPLPSDWNAPLDELKKRADALLGQLEKLQYHHHANSAFWRSPSFVDNKDDHEPDDQVDEPARDVVIRTVEMISSAAAQARFEQQGRPTEHRKQHAVDRATEFWVRHSPYEISGTSTGKFADFARAFYLAARGNGGDTPDLDRQIKRAAARVVSERKPPVLS
ncbi:MULTISPECIES: hypothetical protein [unclassified Mesorhizobium]|uniref:hypothetical protein n=1 Tax=unclassified Mesorhizobium TaxID=325217 RepID=UPI000FDAC5CA|nr:MULTISPECIES: hypothetical protein [unclassified Mesorhizobium]TGQ16380.1 hypothetical protein EN862_002460 [Mesorhizobium sp. M2E.F.Ca.ET.219.01.1.1]TGT77523.1 hypothetical protein EN809_008100 [Mesorhizobium sp. M2E.F.Ca.ET.166.01.1.1]TGW03632.1 hypothetical protein EN797_008100 [Mesorhizobium sp. M2E.F.Ca.ET.154.01.1.1]